MTYQPRHTNGNTRESSRHVPRHSIQVERGRYLMEFAHRNAPVFLLFYANRVNPFRPIHSDVAMCRVLMAAGHGVTDTQALILASR
jgi:hypothetical protein